jgi:hypothetical protein
MLNEAEAGNWQALDHLDIRRKELIGQNGNASYVPAQHEVSEPNYDKVEYGSLCTQILQLDTKIIETVKTAKEKLVKENRNMRNQVVAKQGYAQTASTSMSFSNQT